MIVEYYIHINLPWGTPALLLSKWLFPLKRKNRVLLVAMILNHKYYITLIWLSTFIGQRVGDLPAYWSMSMQSIAGVPLVNQPSTEAASPHRLHFYSLDPAAQRTLGGNRFPGQNLPLNWSDLEKINTLSLMPLFVNAFVGRVIHIQTADLNRRAIKRLSCHYAGKVINPMIVTQQQSQ